MLQGSDILCISSIDWDFIWQGHQEIMTRLAKEGNRVLFVENTGVRAPGLRDFRRLVTRFANWRKGTKGFRQVRENIFVYSPVILPFPYSRIACWINRGLLLRALRRWMEAVGFRRPILWTFLPTPIMRALARALNPELTIYYCIDDLASSSPQARRIRRSENQVFREADLVFVTSEKLRERAAQFSDRVHFFPFGVDFEAFEAIRTGEDGIPEDLRSLARPIIGYVGGVHQWFDQDLLAEMADRMPQATFALVGPPQTNVTKLTQRANIHLLRARPHAEVPRYIKAFDIGIISYRKSDYTDHVYPTKLNEYLAMGIPVVATDLPEIRRFNDAHGNIVAVAHNADEFVGAIRAGLKGSPSDIINRRIAVARENGWTARLEKMSALIEERRAVRRAGGPRWEVTLSRIYRTARTHAFRLTLGLAVVYGLLFHTPFVWLVASPLHVAEAPREADAIVVFAGGVGESGKAGGGYQERVKQAVDLYQDEMASRMIFSSGFAFVFREAEVMRELAVAQGVPSSAILLEAASKNTYENVAFVDEILEGNRWRSILLVSSPYHMRRALLTWRKAAPDITVIPVPVPRSQFYTRGRYGGASLEQIRGILHEYFAIIVYAWRGWI